MYLGKEMQAPSFRVAKKYHQSIVTAYVRNIGDHQWWLPCRIRLTSTLPRSAALFSSVFHASVGEVMSAAGPARNGPCARTGR